MLVLVLMAQLNTASAIKPQPLKPISRTLETLDARSQPQAWTEYLQKQQQWLNQNQSDYQQERKHLEQNSLPSRLDCFPLFPPVADYPTGSSGIDCARP